MKEPSFDEHPNVTDFFDPDREDDAYQQIEEDERWSTAHKVIFGICIFSFAVLVAIAVIHKAA